MAAGTVSRARDTEGYFGRRRMLVDAAVLLQTFSAVYFLSDFIADLGRAGTPDGDPLYHLLLEALAVLGLFVGAAFSMRERRRLKADAQRMQDQLRMASGAFHELVEDFFDRWGLTGSEQEVALLTIKGFSNAEIAGLRNTREGTVKAQSNAIFRKADVAGRPQLLGLFIDELIGKPVLPELAAPSQEPGRRDHQAARSIQPPPSTRVPQSGA